MYLRHFDYVSWIDTYYRPCRLAPVLAILASTKYPRIVQAPRQVSLASFTYLTMMLACNQLFVLASPPKCLSSDCTSAFSAVYLQPSKYAPFPWYYTKNNDCTYIFTNESIIDYALHSDSSYVLNMPTMEFESIR